MINDRIGGVWKVKTANVEGNGGAQSLTIKPASEDEIWILHWARATHTDDGGNRTLDWYLDDNIIASATLLRSSVSVAANVEYMAFGADIKGPLVLEADGLNLIIQGTGILAGHYLGYACLVEVFKSPVAKTRLCHVP